MDYSKLSLIFLIVLSISSKAQERIDGTFTFQTDDAKKYSLFIPEEYNEDTPHKMMLALHPWNPDRWDAISWCDTLINFATMNSLILVVPDGDEDGQIDDPIDTAFTSALLDSVHTWYNINENKKYVMGFSWGGKTTYTYGLVHSWRFDGFMPIGAAINGIAEVEDVLEQAANKPWYLVHGEDDSPALRYYEMLEGLQDNNAITNSTLLDDVGHTIDFDNRDEILSTAFQWIDSVNCASIDTGTLELEESNSIRLSNSVAQKGDSVYLIINSDNSLELEISMFSNSGKLIFTQKSIITEGENRLAIQLNQISGGNYIVLARGNGINSSHHLHIE